MDQKRICPNCGFTNKEGVRFCVQCGHQFIDEPEVKETVPSEEEVISDQESVSEDIQDDSSNEEVIDDSSVSGEEKPNMKICPHCGNQVKAESMYCPKCGHSFEERVKPKVEPQPEVREEPEVEETKTFAIPSILKNTLNRFQRIPKPRLYIAIGMFIVAVIAAFLIGTGFFEPNRQVTVIFNGNAGVASTTSVETYSKKKIVLPYNIYEKYGYTFEGWESESGKVYKEGASVRYRSKENTTTFNAVWKPMVFTITFDSNGGTGTMESLKYEYGSAGTLPINTFTKTDAVFKGWTYNDKTISNMTTLKYLIDRVGVSSTDIQLTAVWGPTHYTITFDSNGGTGSMDPQEFNYDSNDVLKKNTFKKKYYKFLYWTCNKVAIKDGQYLSIVAAASKDSSSDIKLVAQWVLDKEAIIKDIKITTLLSRKADNGYYSHVVMIKNNTNFNLNMKLKFKFNKGDSETGYSYHLPKGKDSIEWRQGSAQATSCKVTVTNIAIDYTENYNNKIKVDITKKGKSSWTYKITNNSDKTLRGYLMVFGKNSDNSFAYEPIPFTLSAGESGSYKTQYSYSRYKTRHHKLYSVYATY